MTPVHIYIGGGAAGFFAAINAAERNPRARHIIYEATSKPMSKILLSGGGRCNVTHNCFVPKELVKNFPRGHKELLGPFTSVFQPKHTIEWFKNRGVELKAESDGRMFPSTNSSETIAALFQAEVDKLGVELFTRSVVSNITVASDTSLPKFKVTIKQKSKKYVEGVENGERVIYADNVLLSTGSFQTSYNLATQLGHTLSSPIVPSLFTFKCDCSHILLQDMMGTSFSTVSITMIVPHVDPLKKAIVIERSGPLMITHWGLSGPAILKLSAFGARELYHCNYKAKLCINWIGGLTKYALVKNLSAFDWKSDEWGDNILNNDLDGENQVDAEILLSVLKRIKSKYSKRNVVPSLHKLLGFIPASDENHCSKTQLLSKRFIQRMGQLTFSKYLLNSTSSEMEKLRWCDVTMMDLRALCVNLTNYGGIGSTPCCNTMNTIQVIGKGEFKEEFVSCGGINSKEVNFKTMESRICPGLFFAGELLDVDGVTGGFNFQNAWTTSWIAANSMNARHDNTKDEK